MRRMFSRSLELPHVQSSGSTPPSCLPPSDQLPPVSKASRRTSRLRPAGAPEASRNARSRLRQAAQAALRLPPGSGQPRGPRPTGRLGGAGRPHRAPRHIGCRRCLRRKRRSDQAHDQAGRWCPWRAAAGTRRHLTWRQRPPEHPPAAGVGYRAAGDSAACWAYRAGSGRAWAPASETRRRTLRPSWLALSPEAALFSAPEPEHCPRLP